VDAAKNSLGRGWQDAEKKAKAQAKGLLHTHPLAETVGQAFSLQRASARNSESFAHAQRRPEGRCKLKLAPLFLTHRATG